MNIPEFYLQETHQVLMVKSRDEILRFLVEERKIKYSETHPSQRLKAVVGGARGRFALPSSQVF